MFTSPRAASWLPVLSNAALILTKLAAALITGSLSLLSDALDSTVDWLSSFIAFFAIRVAARPPDRQHPFGHAKAENVSGVLESLLIMAGAGYVAYAAVGRLLEPRPLVLLPLGIGVMVGSVVVNLLVSRHLLRVARRHESVALEASARHRASDVYTSLGVLAGLVVVQLSVLFGLPLYILDPVIALVVAGYVAWMGVSLFRKAFAGLMDTRLPEEEEQAIREILGRYTHRVALRRLQTRHAGHQRRIVLVLVMCQNETVGESHRLVTRVEEEIRRALPSSNTITHVEPCADTPDRPCPATCPVQGTSIF